MGMWNKGAGELGPSDDGSTLPPIPASLAEPEKPWTLPHLTPEERAWAVIAAASDTDGSETAEIITSAIRAAVAAKEEEMLRAGMAAAEEQHARTEERIRAAVEQAKAEEREACAKVAEAWANPALVEEMPGHFGLTAAVRSFLLTAARGIAAEIRARSEVK